MNSENIQKLIELFGTLGASSKEAFIWFIILDFSKFLIAIILVGVVVTLIYRLIRKAIGSEGQEKALKKLRNEANLGHSSWLDDDDIAKILNHYLRK